MVTYMDCDLSLFDQASIIKRLWCDWEQMFYSLNGLDKNLQPVPQEKMDRDLFKSKKLFLELAYFAGFSLESIMEFLALMGGSSATGYTFLNNQAHAFLKKMKKDILTMILKQPDDVWISKTIMYNMKISD